MCTNLARSPACTHGLQHSLRPYGNLGGAAASGRHAPARSMLAQRLKQPTWVNSEVLDISAFWGRRKTTSVAATTHLALVDGCRTPDRLLQVPPRGAGESVWPRRPKRSGQSMVSPHCVVILSEATAGRNSVTKAPRRLASTRTIAEARGKMLAGSSRQYQGAGQYGDKIGDSGENWFPEVSTKRPSSNKSSAAKVRTAAPLRTCPLKRFRTACSEPS